MRSIGSKADVSQLNLPRGTENNNRKIRNRKLKTKKTKYKKYCNTFWNTEDEKYCYCYRYVISHATVVFCMVNKDY